MGSNPTADTCRTAAWGQHLSIGHGPRSCAKFRGQAMTPSWRPCARSICCFSAAPLAFWPGAADPDRRRAMQHDCACECGHGASFPSTELLRHFASRCQFARVVKGVDLRSTTGNCAWVQTPQLTLAGQLLGASTSQFATVHEGVPSSGTRRSRLRGVLREIHFFFLAPSAFWPRGRPTQTAAGPCSVAARASAAMVQALLALTCMAALPPDVSLPEWSRGWT